MKVIALNNLIFSLLLFNGINCQSNKKKVTLEITDFFSDGPCNPFESDISNNPECKKDGGTITTPTKPVETTAAPVINPVTVPKPVTPDPNTYPTTLIGQGEGENEIGGEASYQVCGSSKICVSFYNCKNGTINTDGEGLLDIRFDKGEGEDIDCPSQMEACCATGDLNKVRPTNEPTKEDLHKNCGVLNTNGIYFDTIGGREGETQYGEFPWMIAVLTEVTVKGKLEVMYQCGGSLIHPEVVLTAAHCVHKFKPLELIVRAGEWDVKSKNEIYKEQDRTVIEILLHEEFTASNLFNDIALLHTDKPFNLRIDVNTVCLPPPQMAFENNRCFATGWGKDKFGQKGKYSVFLKKIDLPIISHDVCQDKLRGTRLSKFYQLHHSFICAGGEHGKDTCKGDGGSPLSCPIKHQEGKYYQAGIVAWGIGCGGDTPGVYVNVANFREWIDQSMSKWNFDTSYYTPRTGF